MKKLFLSLLGITLFSACSTPMRTTVYVDQQPQRQAPPPAMQENSYQLFYDELASYGNWFDYPGYGYVWQPNLGPDFRPYATNGHWAYSEAGWTWVSGYQWGWAAFHYGRWFYENGYGWLWVPGHQWAPAWVTWGQSGQYYGWAPMSPHIEAAQNWNPPADSWIFVPAEHVTKPNVINYTLVHNSAVVNNIVNNVTIINNVNNTVNNTNVTNNNVHINNNVVYNRGPQVNDVEKVTNIKVQQVNIQENNRPGTTTVNNHNLVIYRPVIKPAEQQPKDNNKPKPQQVRAFQPRPAQ